RQEKLKQEQLKFEKQEQLRLEKQEQLKLEKQQQQEQLRLDKQQQLKQDKLREEKLKKAQLDKAQQAALDKKIAEQQTRQLEAQREKNLARITGLATNTGVAGGTGAPTSTGNALRSSGPSASYAGRIRARIKPNIVFTEDIAGNPTAEVEVRTAPDGTIIGHRLLKSSGVAAWDQAVIKAIDKTEVLPRDTDGTLPSIFLLIFRPKD
ncbi:MAG: TonB C-terminal domain-containing protein, partial [Rhodoferax sp.]